MATHAIGACMSARSVRPFPALLVFLDRRRVRFERLDSRAQTGKERPSLRHLLNSITGHTFLNMAASGAAPSAPASSSTGQVPLLDLKNLSRDHGESRYHYSRGESLLPDEREDALSEDSDSSDPRGSEDARQTASTVGFDV